MADPPETVPVIRLGPGDLVTETTTPTGPWYRVLSVDRPGGSLTVEDDGHPVAVPVDDWSAGVLRRAPRGSDG